MLVVTAFALFMTFATGPVMLGGIADEAECKRVGALLQPDPTKRACFPYKIMSVGNTDVLTPH